MARTPRTAGRAGARHPGVRAATIRQWHLYIGVFIAPSLLFFAFTGALQLFGLHEAHGDYQPPAVIAGLSKVHKDQVFAVKEKPDAGGAPAESAPAAHDHEDKGPRPATLILKVFFLAVASSLIVSTLLGLWIALTQSRHKTVAWGLLIAGVVIPIGLLLA